MSKRELERAEVFGRVNAGGLTLRESGELLGLSYPRSKRLWKQLPVGWGVGVAAR